MREATLRKQEEASEKYYGWDGGYVGRGESTVFTAPVFSLGGGGGGGGGLIFLLLLSGYHDGG